MDESLNSWERRISKEIALVFSEMGIKHTPELDFASASMDANSMLEEPVAQISTIQSLPETTRVPIANCRITVTFGVSKNAGTSPFEQGLKAQAAANVFSNWVTRKASARIGGRNFRKTNQDVQNLGLYRLILFQFECQIFLNKGEYSC